MSEAALEYRVLPAEERDRLKPIFEKLNWFLPLNGLASFAVCEDEGTIVSVLPLQLIPHEEPYFVEEAYRGRVNFLRMHETIQTVLPENKTKASRGVLLVASTENIEKMAELAGFTKVKGSLWKKEF